MAVRENILNLISYIIIYKKNSLRFFNEFSITDNIVIYIHKMNISNYFLKILARTSLQFLF